MGIGPRVQNWIGRNKVGNRARDRVGRLGVGKPVACAKWAIDRVRHGTTRNVINDDVRAWRGVAWCTRR